MDMKLKAAIVTLSIAWAAGVLTNHSVLTAQGKSQWDGVYTAEQAKRGGAVFSKECASCHGEMLEGMGEAPSLVGGEFASAWNELTLFDLFERMRKSMPKETPGSLSGAQYADIVAFILSRNEAPAGKTALAATPEALKGVVYKMSK
jgi:mono/diheme cytochrome c family protein